MEINLLKVCLKSLKIYNSISLSATVGIYAPISISQHMIAASSLFPIQPHPRNIGLKTNNNVLISLIDTLAAIGGGVEGGGAGMRG